MEPGSGFRGSTLRAKISRTPIAEVVKVEKLQVELCGEGSLIAQWLSDWSIAYP